MNETILQFGTGNFLRAFVGDFIDRLNRLGLYDGGIVIVSPTDSKNVETINAQNGRYHLILRGISDGKTVNEMREITAVSRAVNPYRDFEAFLSLAESETLRFVISNTTEAGIAFDPDCMPTDRPCAAFPAKVAQFLLRRFRAGLPGLVFFACELIDRNADKLRKCVLDYCELWHLPAGFKAWVENENRFCNTLVDRIVTGFPEDAERINASLPEEDRLLTAAEPYHFWAVEGDYEAELPLRRAGLNVVWSDDITFYKKRKVSVLNGAHTSIVFPALLAGIETVGECLDDPQLRAFLNECLSRYILPVLGDTEENRAYADAVLERFSNPFIHHKLRSIALNSVSKYTARILPTLLGYHNAFREVPKPMILSLCSLIRYYRTNDAQDQPEHIAFIREKGLAEILKNDRMWGIDLSGFLPEAEECFAIDDIREAIRWSMS